MIKYNLIFIEPFVSVIVDQESWTVRCVYSEASHNVSLISQESDSLTIY